jgi:glycosyltransferase involved in cell wall biosynthesis
MKPRALPLVSIVTPSFNQAPFLEETIKSVLEQDYPHIEYIVMDGGSTDGSIEIIKKYASPLENFRHSIHAWVSEQDQGQTDAINKGFARAKGDILAWINSDDTYNPKAVGEAVLYLMENPDVAMVYADCNFIDEQGKTCDWQIRVAANRLPSAPSGIRPHPAADDVLPYKILDGLRSARPIVLFCDGLRSLGADRSMRAAQASARQDMGQLPHPYLQQDERER